MTIEFEIVFLKNAVPELMRALELDGRHWSRPVLASSVENLAHEYGKLAKRMHKFFKVSAGWKRKGYLSRWRLIQLAKESLELAIASMRWRTQVFGLALQHRQAPQDAAKDYLQRLCETAFALSRCCHELFLLQQARQQQAEIAVTSCQMRIDDFQSAVHAAAQVVEKARKIALGGI